VPLVVLPQHGVRLRLPLQAPIDFNQYLGIQRAGIACLQLPQQRVREYAAVWRQRAAALVPVLRRFGWKLPEPKACKYPPPRFEKEVAVTQCVVNLLCPAICSRHRHLVTNIPRLRGLHVDMSSQSWLYVTAVETSSKVSLLAPVCCPCRHVLLGEAS
jgi:hypothetical protein